MITTVIRVAWLNFVRDRVALALTFILPLVFFSIFALVFGGMGGDTADPIDLAVCDEDRTEASRRFIDALKTDPSLAVRLADKKMPDRPLDRKAVEGLVGSGGVSAGLILPKGFAESFGTFGMSGDAKACDLLIDKSNPIAGPMVAGLLQRAAMTGAPELMVERGVEMLDRFVTPFSDAQRDSIRAFLPTMRTMITPTTNTATTRGSDTASSATVSGPLAVNIVDVIGQRNNTPMIAYYAAGTAVLFLLFSAAGAGGALLEEEENGVLARLLNSKLTMTQLLLGKWLVIATIGAVQVFLMFIWGSIAFGVRLFDAYHLTGFWIMTIVTAAAAAAFGLVIAAACRSRAQLGGVSTIVILVMSAVGGSMFPRFAMPAGMKTAGYATFNAWALDGYQKVFWWRTPLLDLWPQVLVLTGITVVFLAASRLLARRWERA